MKRFPDFKYVKELNTLHAFLEKVSKRMDIFVVRYVVGLGHQAKMVLQNGWDLLKH